MHYIDTWLDDPAENDWLCGACVEGELQTRLAEIQKSAAPELSFVKVAQENSVASSNIHPLLSPGAGPGSAAFWIGLKCRGKVLKASLHQVKITTAEYCNYLQLLYVTSSNICLISARNKGEPIIWLSDLATNCPSFVIGDP